MIIALTFRTSTSRQATARATKVTISLIPLRKVTGCRAMVLQRSVDFCSSANSYNVLSASRPHYQRPAHRTLVMRIMEWFDMAAQSRVRERMEVSPLLAVAHKVSGCGEFGVGGE
jgi:hypothetical protein